jgi:hypothetical protein
MENGRKSGGEHSGDTGRGFSGSLWEGKEPVSPWRRRYARKWEPRAGSENALLFPRRTGFRYRKKRCTRDGVDFTVSPACCKIRNLVWSISGYTRGVVAGNSQVGTARVGESSYAAEQESLACLGWEIPSLL